MTYEAVPRARATLPTFVGIGAMKCGTTALHRALSTHPDIGMAQPKELHFFSRNAVWRKGVAWYASQFPVRAVRGEVSPSYTKLDLYPLAAERMASVIPEAKLLYLVRDPVERLISHYRHGVAGGTIRSGIEQAITDHPSLVETGRYGARLREYLRWYPLDQVLVLESAQLDRAHTIQRILEFIGADPDQAPPDVPRVHTTSGKYRSRVVSRSRRVMSQVPTATSVAERLTPSLRRRIHLATSSPVPTHLLDDVSLSSAMLSRLRRCYEDDLRVLRACVGPEVGSWAAGWR